MTTRVLVRGRQECQSQRKRYDDGNREIEEVGYQEQRLEGCLLKMEGRPQAKEYRYL